MMRLQRVGRRNDPSYRIVVTDKRTGPKSDKHVDRLGSYNPKMNHIQLDGEKAKEWLAKGVQPSDTLYNLLVSEGVVEGRKKNVLPKKSPVIKEEAEKTEEAGAPAEEVADAGTTDNEEETGEESPATEEKAEAAPVEEEKPAEEEKSSESPAEEKEKTEAPKEKPAEETKEETPAEEPKEETEEGEDKKEK